MGPVLGLAVSCVSFELCSATLASLSEPRGTYAFKVLDVVLALSQGFVFRPKHLSRDLWQGGRLGGNNFCQFCSFLLDIFLLQLGFVLFPDPVPFSDDMEDATHGLLQFLDSSDLACLSDVGGVVFQSQLIGKD